MLGFFYWLQRLPQFNSSGPSTSNRTNSTKTRLQLHLDRLASALSSSIHPSPTPTVGTHQCRSSNPLITLHHSRAPDPPLRLPPAVRNRLFQPPTAHDLSCLPAPLPARYAADPAPRIPAFGFADAGFRPDPLLGLGAGLGVDTQSEKLVLVHQWTGIRVVATVGGRNIEVERTARKARVEVS